MKKVFIFAVLFVLFSAVAHAEDKVIIIPLGRTVNIEAPIEWHGQWLEQAEYVVGDGIQYLGSSYICVEIHVASIATSPPNSSFWSLMALQGDRGYWCKWSKRNTRGRRTSRHPGS